MSVKAVARKAAGSKAAGSTAASSKALAGKAVSGTAVNVGPASGDAAGEVRERILAVIRGIPAGQVLGYGHVAARAGLPGRARLVAKILSGNDDASLPWHRVLRSDGRVAMPEGSAGWSEQCQRLRAEGVVVEGGRARSGLPASPADLDRALWGPPGG